MLLHASINCHEGSVSPLMVRPPSLLRCSANRARFSGTGTLFDGVPSTSPCVTMYLKDCTTRVVDSKCHARKSATFPIVGGSAPKSLTQIALTDVSAGGACGVPTLNARPRCVSICSDIRAVFNRPLGSNSSQRAAKACLLSINDTAAHLQLSRALITGVVVFNCSQLNLMQPLRSMPHQAHRTVSFAV